MIKVYLNGHKLEYEIKDIINLFFNDNIVFVNEIPASSRDIFISSSLSEKAGEIVVSSKVIDSDIYEEEITKREITEDSSMSRRKIIKRAVKFGLMRVLVKATKKEIPWGMLTGIRPTKVVQELFDKGMNDDEILNKLQVDFGVFNSKASIMIQVARNEAKILNRNNDPNIISVYVGIPFCPDRCLYCSFTSNPIKKYAKVVDSFIEAIKKEINAVGKIIDAKGWKIESLYMGGGTPTSLNNEQMCMILEEVDRVFKLSSIEEFTIEAGRPDTLDREKLATMKKYGVNRISINPQTMNHETLRLIGRNHSIEDIETAFNITRAEGFDNINMDVIVGLPGEDESMMLNTLDRIKTLGPESLTVHTLAIKRGSKLVQDKKNYVLPDESEVQAMIELCRSKAAEMGMIPYYLYRQKNMVGHQENVGYSFSGKECTYNIKMIEEVQSILALGPGAVTRYLYRETGAIEKIFNDKSVEGYIARIDEMIERKINACK